MNNTSYGHVPVMARRITELVALAVESVDHPVVVDCTLGAGGHTENLLVSFPRLCVIGVDRDESALATASDRLARFGDRFVAVKARFDDLDVYLAQDNPVLTRLDTHKINGFLFDFGVSSMQLDRPERGFSYAADAPLDMRMDASQELTAATIVNTYDHGELAHILKAYGDERFAGRIASFILKARQHDPITTTGQLVEIIYDAIPAPARRSGGHPAKRTFQALRVAVNNELDSIAHAVPQALDRVAPGGVVVVMSYQSHEDKIVKRLFADRCSSTTPTGLPVDLPGCEPTFTSLTRGAEKADEQEKSVNRRAQSVRVRAVQKLT